MKINIIEVNKNDKFLLTFPKDSPYELKQKYTEEFNNLLSDNDQLSLNRFLNSEKKSMSWMDNIELTVLNFKE